MPVAVAVAAGGALGALARYGLDRLIERRSFSVFPWSTFAINVSGEETLDLTEANDYAVAVVNVSVSVLAGLAAVLVGNHLGRPL